MSLLWLLLLAVVRHEDIVRRSKLYLSCSNRVSDMFLKRRCQRRENPQYCFRAVCHQSFAQRATISRTKRALQSLQIRD